MAEKAPSEDEADASRESFLDQFLRRLDQTDQEAAASPSTSVAPSSSEYSSTANPWFLPSPLSLDLPTATVHSVVSRAPASSPYALPANPLAEFPWLLEEFDHQQRALDSSRLVGDPESHDSAQRLYSAYSQLDHEQILGASSSEGAIKDEQTKVGRRENVPGHGSGSKLDAAGPVPRFERTISSVERLGEAGASAGVARQVNYRPPSSPLLSEAAAGAGGSVTTSAGTSNTSLSSESTSNAGDEDESEAKGVATEGASSGKRKKPEEGGAAGETPESKKPDQPKNKPRKRGGAKRLREPRYAIKTRTDVDVLDDGFKWRKYGQKAVKNSPHPRNYYRCTTPLCPVRKRVERSNEDAGLVITTYEGTHTHQTPGFHRPSAGGYFGDRPLGMGGGLFQSPLGPGSNLLPLPPGFDLASLQQATALRNIRGLQPNQNLVLPGSSQQQQQQDIRQQLGGLQQESLFRAQQFLGLQDPTFGSVKQEPYQFTAQDFMSRNISLPLPGSHAATPGMTSGPSPSQLLNRSISDIHALQSRPGGSPLFAGLNFPKLPISGGNMNITDPASSSNIAPREPDTSMNRGQGRHELLPAGVGSGSSSRIDQSLETLVSSSGHPNFDQAQGPDRPQPAGRSIGSNPTILGSGSLDPLTRGGQQRTSVPTMQAQHQHQHQHQHSFRSGPAGGVSSSSENLQGQASESDVAREGLLQDMVRHGGPKVSKS